MMVKAIQKIQISPGLGCVLLSFRYDLKNSQLQRGSHQGSSKNKKKLYKLAPKLFPFLFGKLITMKNFKILTGLEVLPPDPHFQTQKYKGFSKSVKGKYSKHVLQLLNLKRFFFDKIESMSGIAVVHTLLQTQRSTKSADVIY